MKLSIGIVGLPNVGKSSLFKLLTSNDILIANYPFATIDPNVGVVAVPDERVDVLAKTSKSAKRIPAIVEFYDIAGLVKGASTGEGLGNQFLAHIRDVSAIVQVVRCFPAQEILHIENSVDPIRDLEIVNAELALKDLETIQKRLPRAEADMRGNVKGAREEVECLKKLEQLLQSATQHYDIIANVIMLGGKNVKNLNLLSAKPKFYLLNGKPEDVPTTLIETIKKEGNEYVITDLTSAVTASDSAAVQDNMDRHGATAPRDDMGSIIKKAYEILGLISFFTTGEDETRAWTIEKGTKAPQAAGVIHTDFEKKFIRAEAVSYKDFVECGGPSTGSTSSLRAGLGQAGANPWATCRAKGKLRVEGKDYVVQDGDIMEIRHS